MEILQLDTSYSDVLGYFVCSHLPVSCVCLRVCVCVCVCACVCSRADVLGGDAAPQRNVLR